MKNPYAKLNFTLDLTDPFWLEKQFHNIHRYYSLKMARIWKTWDCQKSNNWDNEIAILLAEVWRNYES